MSVECSTSVFYIIKLYYFVAVLSLTYTPILPTFFKNKNVDKIKNVKNVKNVTRIKKNVKNVFLHQLCYAATGMEDR